MFNLPVLFFGIVIIVAIGVKSFNRKRIPIQYLAKGCDVHRDDYPKTVAKQKLGPIVMLGIIVGILGNIPNVIVLVKDYILPILY